MAMDQLMRNRLKLAVIVLVFGSVLIAGVVHAQGTEFTGSVVMVDPSAGKLAVKKEDGGTRFTFVVNDKTQFEGAAKGLKDLKKGDGVTVQYQVMGSQYLATKVGPKK